MPSGRAANFSFDSNRGKAVLPLRASFHRSSGIARTCATCCSTATSGACPNQDSICLATSRKDCRVSSRFRCSPSCRSLSSSFNWRVASLQQDPSRHSKQAASWTTTVRGIFGESQKAKAALKTRGSNNHARSVSSGTPSFSPSSPARASATDWQKAEATSCIVGAPSEGVASDAQTMAKRCPNLDTRDSQPRCSCFELSTAKPRARFVAGSCRCMDLYNSSRGTQWGGCLKRATSRISTKSFPAWKPPIGE
mmetsp:Transcript_77974/g.170884  ORF Transcript_77974/g.170884 Transcript_77974/m.170884 type:complete len:252 (-) Transcript_77974:214-969(-)